MPLVDVIVAVGWAGAANGPAPSSSEPSSAIIALVLTVAVHLWGRRIDRQRARKILPFRREERS
jgi:hypothetical protein